MRSKAYWGYDAEFLDACEDELTVSAAAVADEENHWVVACETDRLLGFYGLVPQDRHTADLEALFVEPECVRTGVGRALLEDARLRATRDGFERIVIQSDPYAADFYLAMGAVKTGERPSGSIPGRMLPLFEIRLGNAP